MSRLTGPVLTFCAAITLFSAATSVQSYPAYAQKEKKSCAYCHQKAAGGGARNYRGAYYKEHTLSFASFDDKAEAKKAGVDVGPDATPNPASYTAPARSGDAKKPTATKKPAKTSKKTKPKKGAKKG